MILIVSLSVLLILIVAFVVYLSIKQSEILSKFKDIKSNNKAHSEALRKITRDLKNTKKLLKKHLLLKETSVKETRHIVNKETVKDLISDLENDGFLTKNEGTQSAKDIIIIQEFIHHGDDEGIASEELTVILDEARELVKATGIASISHLGKRLSISRKDAELILDRLEDEGIVGPSDGSSHRNVFERE